MFTRRRKPFILASAVGLVSLTAWLSQAEPHQNTSLRDWKSRLQTITTGLTAQPKKQQGQDTTQIKYIPSRRPKLQFKDRAGDPFSNNFSTTPLILPPPSNLKIEVVPDDSLKRYEIREQLGDLDYRTPSTMTFEEYSRYQQRESIRNYWRSKSATLDEQNPAAPSRRLVPRIDIGGRTFDRLFGGSFVDIRPNGLATLKFGALFNKNENPAIPLRQQSVGDFEFDQSIALNIDGRIGEKLRITANWDTKANFDFENNLKLEYTGYPEEIIRKIEAGNVSMPLNSSLITGGQNLFGLKTQLQLGRLSVTAIAANQRGSIDQVNIQNGAQNRNFEIRADEYDADRHFFLAQFFRGKYDQSLRNLPLVNSGIVIRRLEVYITNDNRTTENLRNIVALMDIGEADPFRTRFDTNQPTGAAAGNNQNSLFDQIKGQRNNNQVENALDAQGLQKSVDYEHVRARRLDQREYKFNPQLGYISLNSALLPEQVLGVAFEYTLNGRTYKVGELQDDYQNVTEDQVIFLKMLRATNPSLQFPTWDLMMKNVYSLNANQIERQNFQLNIVYKDDQTGADLTSLQDESRIKGTPLVRVFNLDNVNTNNDKPADGNFDFLPGITIDPENGRIYFPEVEPFGSYLQNKLGTAQEEPLTEKYVFEELYDSIQTDAQQFSNKNKFFLRGRYQASSTDEITLPGIRIAEGSVAVYSGGTRLVEGQDYQVFYDLGRVKILNPSYLNNANNLRVTYEKADILNVQPRTLLGARFDYKVDNDLIIGATVMHQGEQPFINRVSIGDEPTNNTIYGMDINYRRDSRFLTNLTDKLPFLTTKVPSTVTLGAEFARLVPNTTEFEGEDGVSYIDDFENAETPYSLGGFNTNIWRLAATPAPIANGTSGLETAFKRAKIAWYTIDQIYYTPNDLRPSNITKEELENHYTRGVQRRELFPNRDPEASNTFEYTFDLAYYPAERGQYNYNPGLLGNNRLPGDPRQNWAGISREISFDNNFDNANIEYLEFWMLNPFIDGDRGRVNDGEGNNANNTTGGELVFNLGNVSEDLLKDQRYEFENGLPTDPAQPTTDPTIWGRVTRNQFLTDAFDNNPSSRQYQDIGLDGLNNTDEKNFFQGIYANLADPSGDDFRHHLDADYDARNIGILGRYKNFNGMEGNSPVNSNQSSYAFPDKEDLNRDNVISDLEQYYEYKLNLRPSTMNVGQNYIVDKVDTLINGTTVSWYQFRIPVRKPTGTVGGIQGFKSIRFMRMYMTQFEQPVVLRFVQMQFVANQWRTYNSVLTDGGPCTDCDSDADNFTVSTVNVEENGEVDAGTIPYVLPPGVERQRDYSSANNRRQNEQSLQLCVENLRDGFSKAVYKNVSQDMLIYKRLKMYLHAQSSTGTRDGEMVAFLRIGSDFTQNYYEYAIPLQITPEGTRDPNAIWNEANFVDVAFDEFVRVKSERNRAGFDLTKPYSITVNGKTLTVVGNPDFSDVQSLMIGLQNPITADRASNSVCLWLNELRVSDFDRKAGWAATARANVKLADFANITATGSYTTVGFGGIQERAAQRSRENTGQFDINANIAAEKLLPAGTGLVVPLSVQYGTTVAEPRYDPLDRDTPLDTSLDKFDEGEERDAYRKEVVSQTTTKSINLLNVRKEKTNPEAKARLYDIENLSFSYAYSEILHTDIITDRNFSKSHRGGIAYNYTASPKSYTPLAKIAVLESPYLRWLKEFNVTLLPSRIAVRADLDRSYNETFLQGRSSPYALPDTAGILPTYQKSFFFNRIYDVKWDLTRSLSLDYTATNRSVIDEPDGRVNNEVDSLRYKNKVIWHNLRRFGRNTNFNQVVAMTYRLPLDKFPLTDWISGDARYEAGYTWTSSSTALRNNDTLQLGNTIENNTQTSLTGKIDLVRLYNKVKILKKVNEATPQPGLRATNTKTVGRPGTAAAADTTQKRDSKVLNGILRTLMSARSINVTYARTEGTLLPGFLPTARNFGLADGFGAPGLGFVLGKQYNLDELYNRADRENWYTDSSQYLNTPLSSLSSTNITARATIEPFRNFIITLDGAMNKSEIDEVYYRRDSAKVVQRQNPFTTGSYRVSFIAVQTLFESNSGNRSAAFENFIRNRATVASRLNAVSPNGVYGLNSQDVLIASFVHAYQGKDINGYEAEPSDPFDAIPLPNWRLEYNGLSQVPFFQKYFSSFTLSHSYQSNFTLANFSSSLDYQFEPAGFPDRTNDLGEVIPYHIINQVSITETMAPLIGINFRTKGQLTGRMEYRTERALLLNMTNAQVTENGVKDYVVGIGYSTTNFRVPFRIGGQRKTLENELTMRLDLTIRDNVTIQRTIGVDASGQEYQNNLVTSGGLQVQLRPTIDYVVSQRLNLQFYFTKNINDPKVANSFRNTMTEGGIQLRFSLSD
ncbi:cell surface protein SprA [Rufibacter sp. DG15C]|uniref:T9SS outer membrane translocon Sov/SprA n=1 Tax=Rufibacter sp. DG15C TaxID=1379909 RepID=UPI0008322909|nr:cell surface protein SprA [Rufibacter sp. DG15C]